MFQMINRIRLLIGMGRSLQEIHDTIKPSPEDEESFFLAYQAANLLCRNDPINQFEPAAQSEELPATKRESDKPQAPSPNQIKADHVET